MHVGRSKPAPLRSDQLTNERNQDSNITLGHSLLELLARDSLGEEALLDC